MIKHIKVWKMVVLSLVTFGIYNTVWLARRRNEMVENYNVAIPRWEWLVAPSLLSLAIFFILTFIQDMGPSLVGAIIVLIPMIVSPFVIWGISIWWMWHFGKAAEKVTRGRVTLVWVMIYAFLLNGYLSYVLQYYFNRLPKSDAASAKQHQPSKRFVKYSIIAIVVVQVLNIGAGIAFALLSFHSSSSPHFVLNI